MAEPIIARLDERALVSVAGPEWRGFLQGLITQDVDSLADGELRYGALLTPQGRLLYDLFVLGGPDGGLVDVDAARRDAFIQRLSMYRLRAKVTVEAVEGRVFALWGADDAEAPWVRDPRLPQLGFRAYGTAPGAATVASEDYDRWRLSLGVPDPARDCRDDTTYPIEANLDLLNGVDFKKGCFVGQETTSRMKRRGPVKNRMLPINFEGPAPAYGAEVMAGALRAGELRSGAHGRALALLRLDRIVDVGLAVEGEPVTVERPAWIPITEP